MCWKMMGERDVAALSPSDNEDGGVDLLSTEEGVASAGGSLAAGSCRGCYRSKGESTITSGNRATTRSNEPRSASTLQAREKA